MVSERELQGEGWGWGGRGARGRGRGRGRKKRVGGVGRRRDERMRVSSWAGLEVGGGK